MSSNTQQNPVSRRRLARDIAEMVDEPYPNTKLIPNQGSLHEACLVLNTGTRFVHATLRFKQGYPRTTPSVVVNGLPLNVSGDRLSCSWILAYDRSVQTQAYTLKTLAIHLLSIFDGETELGSLSDGVERRLRPRWRDYSCIFCGFGTRQCGVFDFAYCWTDLDAINLDADESSDPKPTGLRGLAITKTIRDLPVELLTEVIGYLEVPDIVRFSQAWDRIENIVEDNVVVRNRELQCSVTKEHFTSCPLGVGVRDSRWWFRMGVEFDLISSSAYRDLRVRNSTYGDEFGHWLPLPLSERHWEQVKADALQVLNRLGRTTYSGSRRRMDAMDVLITFMDDHVVKLFTNGGTSGQGARGCRETTGILQVPEKGIESLFFLFHLLLCLAVDNPEYVSKADRMIRSLQAGSTPTQDMPSPGRILMAVLISHVTTDNEFMVNIVTEAITRNVSALLTNHPELAYLEPCRAASEYRLHHTFAARPASYRALLFADLFRRTVRPATSGMTIKQARDLLFRRRGIPPSATTALLAAESRRIMAVDSFRGFVAYLGMTAPVPSARYLSSALRGTVRESVRRSSPSQPLGQADALVLRHMAEHWSTLPRTEGLPPCPARPACWEAIARAEALGYYPRRPR